LRFALDSLPFASSASTSPLFSNQLQAIGFVAAQDALFSSAFSMACGVARSGARTGMAPGAL
jgi:hypothetical protein